MATTRECREEDRAKEIERLKATIETERGYRAEEEERLTQERDEFDARAADWIQEADRLRQALEWIGDCFVPDQRKTYGSPDETLHGIREKAAATLSEIPKAPESLGERVERLESELVDAEAEIERNEEVRHGRA